MRSPLTVGQMAGLEMSDCNGVAWDGRYLLLRGVGIVGGATVKWLSRD